MYKYNKKINNYMKTMYELEIYKQGNLSVSNMYHIMKRTKCSKDEYTQLVQYFSWCFHTELLYGHMLYID